MAKSLVQTMRADIDLMVHKPKGAGKQRRRTELIHRAMRWCVQIGFLLTFPGAFSAAFNGIKYLFAQIGATAPLEITAFVALLIALLAFTCVFGRFFCGFACAFGTLGDAAYTLAAPLRRALKLDGKRLPSVAQHALQLVKYAVLIAICAACLTGVWSRVSGLSPWVAFAAIDAGSVDGVAAGAFVALAAVILGMAFVERFFCQFLCPLGAVFSLMPVLPASLFRRDRTHCATRCNRCEDRCPVRIHPDRDDLRSGECIACGRCADGCPMANVTLVRIERAAAAANAEAGATAGAPSARSDAARRTAGGKRPRALALHGTEIAPTLVKAALLAAILSLLM